MLKSRSHKIIIVALVILLCISVLLLGRAYWQIYGYRQEIFGLSGMVASEQALADFRNGKLRLLKLNGENDRPKFSGQKDGPYEIWYPQYYPVLGVAHTFATQQYIEFYNRKMENMYKHPEKFLRKIQSDANQR
jgi:hypothetical protein